MANKSMKQGGASGRGKEGEEVAGWCGEAEGRLRQRPVAHVAGSGGASPWQKGMKKMPGLLCKWAGLLVALSSSVILFFFHLTKQTEKHRVLAQNI